MVIHKNLIVVKVRYLFLLTFGNGEVHNWIVALDDDGIVMKRKFHFLLYYEKEVA